MLRLSVCFPEIKGRYVVSLEAHSRRLDDGIVILSVADFIDRPWSGRLF